MTEKIRPYDPHIFPLEAIETDPASPPLVCVSFNVEWLPLILGSLRALTTDFMWKGTQEQQDVMTDNAAWLMRRFEDRCMSIQDIRIEGGELQVKFCEDDLWTTVGSIPQGEPGEPGEPGATPIVVWEGTSLGWDYDNDGISDTGLVDLRGADGDCTCEDYPDAPPIEDTGDLGNLCAGAIGLFTWINEQYQDSLQRIQGWILAGQTVYKIAGSLIDAIPIIGDIAGAVIDYAADVAEKDINHLITIANEVTWIEKGWERFYCALQDEGYPITTEKMAHALYNVIAPQYATDLPYPPFITFAGQSFAAFLTVVRSREALRRLAIYMKETQYDCELFECYQLPGCTGFDIIWANMGATEPDWDAWQMSSGTQYDWERSSNAYWRTSVDWREGFLEVTFPQACQITSFQLFGSRETPNQFAMTIYAYAPDGSLISNVGGYWSYSQTPPASITWNNSGYEYVKKIRVRVYSKRARITRCVMTA